MRFDVLLFELRLFKSRSQATAAIQEGRALLNGERTKPSHVAKAGDRITVPARGVPRTLELLELPHGSLSKQQAQRLVRELVAPDAAGLISSGERRDVE